MKTHHYSPRGSALILTLLISLMLVASNCSEKMKDQDGTGGTPVTNEIIMQYSLFSPASLTVSAGTTVKWTNKDGMTHNVTSDTGVFTSSSISNNGTYSFTFSTPGTYLYHCTLHPSMTGTVVVN